MTAYKLKRNKKMKDLYETLKTVIRDCDALDSKKDCDVVARLKFELCFETEDSSYEYWMKRMIIEKINGPYMSLSTK